VDVGNTAIRAILTVIKFNCLIKREKWGRHFVNLQPPSPQLLYTI